MSAPPLLEGGRRAQDGGFGPRVSVQGWRRASESSCEPQTWQHEFPILVKAAPDVSFSYPNKLKIKKNKEVLRRSGFVSHEIERRLAAPPALLALRRCRRCSHMFVGFFFVLALWKLLLPPRGRAAPGHSRLDPDGSRRTAL